LSRRRPTLVGRDALRAHRVDVRQVLDPVAPQRDAASSRRDDDADVILHAPARISFRGVDLFLALEVAISDRQRLLRSKVPARRTLHRALQEIEQPHTRLSSPRKDGRRKRRSASAASDSITPVDRQPPSLTGYCWLLLAGTKRRPALLRPPA